ncbi:MAG: SUMF1/EgtB/PvdO family nonheme iron enzyme [Polyangiaceae bacterium]|nr:SUMF1/EgtB/PvdO family nonheme iron enzyme [Polyangiaceae bacterium]
MQPRGELSARRRLSPSRAWIWGGGCIALALWLSAASATREALAQPRVAASGASEGSKPIAAPTRTRGCLPEMQRVGAFCIDRWEVRTETPEGQPLSPFYPPDYRILNKIRKVWVLERPHVGPERARAMPLPPLPSWQKKPFKLRAVSEPGVVPQGYMSYYMAKRACAAAGKRLCRDEEWESACKGQAKTKFPYGDDYVAGRCNVFREFHPADVLHLDASSGHRDPRLNLVLENGVDPGLRDTGGTKSCLSHWPGGDVYDMVGNLDEWVEDPKGRFRGGFYSRNTRAGCEAKVANHPAGYFDYSTGTRCCADPR